MSTGKGRRRHAPGAAAAAARTAARALGCFPRITRPPRLEGCIKPKLITERSERRADDEDGQEQTNRARLYWAPLFAHIPLAKFD